MQDLEAKLEKIGSDGLDKIEQYLNSAESFANEQVPLLINELIRWEIASNLIMLITSLLAIVILSFGLFKISVFIYHNVADETDKLLQHLFSTLFIAVPLVFFTSVIVKCISQIIYVLIAPRVFLLEKIGDMINNGV